MTSGQLWQLVNCDKWSIMTTGQLWQLVNYDNWSIMTTGQLCNWSIMTTGELLKQANYDNWSFMKTGQTWHLVKHDIWSSMTFGQTWHLSNKNWHTMTRNKDVYPSARLSVCLSVLICLPKHAHLPAGPPVLDSTCLPVFCTFLSAHLSTCLSVILSVCVFSLCLPVDLPDWLFSRLFSSVHTFQLKVQQNNLIS